MCRPARLACMMRLKKAIHSAETHRVVESRYLIVTAHRASEDRNGECAQFKRHPETTTKISARAALMAHMVHETEGKDWSGAEACLALHGVGASPRLWRSPFQLPTIRLLPSRPQASSDRIVWLQIISPCMPVTIRHRLR